MIRISVSQILHDDSGDSAELLAQFSVDETGIHPEAGERIDVVVAIPVIDPDTGERLTSDDDPVRWAQLLPQSIRSGDLVALVEEVEAGAPSSRAKRDGIAVLAAEAAEGPRAPAAELAH
jgi:hypothetical protein